MLRAAVVPRIILALATWPPAAGAASCKDVMSSELLARI